MLKKLKPQVNNVYFIKRYTLIHILEGQGGIQVDFRVYHDWNNKIIFLEKGQHIKFLTENFVILQLEFSDEEVLSKQNTRVLFKHIIGLGYVNFDSRDNRKQDLSKTLFTSSPHNIFLSSSKQWHIQNPFSASQEENQFIFDVKDAIDSNFKDPELYDTLGKEIELRGRSSKSLFKKKVGISIKSLLRRKRILESKKEIVFSNRSIKEIAYESGFKDPAYFNRVFKKKNGKSPLQFREDFDFEDRDLFIQELYELLRLYHKQERSLDFYAEKMHMSVKTISKKVKTKLNISLGQLIREELIHTAKALLNSDVNIKDVAFQLGFKESNHFSAFFKHHTGKTASIYKKYH